MTLCSIHNSRSTSQCVSHMSSIQDPNLEYLADGLIGHIKRFIFLFCYKSRVYGIYIHICIYIYIYIYIYIHQLLSQYYKIFPEGMTILPERA